jgi:hypothetical protein
MVSNIKNNNGKTSQHEFTGWKTLQRAKEYKRIQLTLEGNQPRPLFALASPFTAPPTLFPKN